MPSGTIRSMPEVTSVVVGDAIAGRYSLDGVSRLQPGLNDGVSFARSSGLGTWVSRCLSAIFLSSRPPAGFMSAGTATNSDDQ